MIKINFYRRNGVLTGFSASGHAGFANAGEDIVCAAVTSAVQLTANGITEIVGAQCDIKVLEDEVSLRLPEKFPDEAVMFLKAFKLHMVTLSQDYSGCISVKFLEV